MLGRRGQHPPSRMSSTTGPGPLALDASRGRGKAARGSVRDTCLACASVSDVLTGVSQAHCSGALIVIWAHGTSTVDHRRLQHPSGPPTYPPTHHRSPPSARHHHPLHVPPLQPPPTCRYASRVPFPWGCILPRGGPGRTLAILSGESIGVSFAGLKRRRCTSGVRFA